MMHLSAARFLLPVPPMFPILVDGAARSGRRTPEPHVWPAAPPSMRGDCWRGAAMDVSDFIWRRCESLRGQAEADGLEPRLALFYWGDVQWLWEIVRQERGIERSDREWHSYCRVSLAESVLERLRRGTLVATALNKGESFRCRVEADHWQGYKAGESLHDLRWSLDTASTRNQALALPKDLSEPVLARISGTLKRFREREQLASVADRLPHTATGWPDLPVMRQIVGVQRKMANDRAFERYNERRMEERPPQLTWQLPTEIAGDARHYSLSANCQI